MKTTPNSSTPASRDLSYCILPSPIDDLILIANPTALIGLYFSDKNHVPAELKTWNNDPDHPILKQATTQLREYFAGQRKDFTIPLHFQGTPFQNQVWRHIASIPHGQTISYSTLAARAGNPAAVRAAGTATGRNPIAVIIPCHRVIGATGAITGFAGGLERKRDLLAMEGIPIALPAPRKSSAAETPSLFTAP